jgi:hypothetical protein
MYLENDAAGLLKSSLDLLNGKALNAAQAQNSFDSSLVNMGDHMSATGQKITFTTTSIEDMSSASVSLRGQLNSQVTNLEAVVEANGGLSESTGKAREQMVTMRQQIIDNAVAHGVDKDAVTAYVDKLLAIPKTVPPTKLDADKSAADAKIAAVQAKIDAIKQGTAPSITADSGPGQAKIAGLQAGIDAIRQGKVPWLDANSVPGLARVSGLQAQINDIRQGRVPALDANSAAGQAKIASLQRQIDGLQDKTVTISTIYRILGAPVPSPIAPGSAAGGLIGRAGGGLLSGPGTGTSDSITGVDGRGVPIVRVSTGEFVVNAAATARNRAQLEAINNGSNSNSNAGAGGQNIYVQNPFTGEYLLAQVATVADTRVAQAQSSRSLAMSRGAR